MNHNKKLVFFFNSNGGQIQVKEPLFCRESACYLQQFGQLSQLPCNVDFTVDMKRVWSKYSPYIQYARTPIIQIRDHPFNTPKKNWAGGLKKQQFLLKFTTVSMLSYSMDGWVKKYLKSADVIYRWSLSDKGTAKGLPSSYSRKGNYKKLSHQSVLQQFSIKSTFSPSACVFEQ